MAHTPGPWVVNAESGFCINADNGNFGVVDMGTIGQLRDAGYPLDEAEANARLIAAAPEMYKLLNRVKNVGIPPVELLKEISTLLTQLDNQK